jgi:acyl dehydratase
LGSTEEGEEEVIMTEAISGGYLDRFVIGATCRHPIQHTLTEACNLLFSTLTHNAEPLYLDVERGGSAPYRARVANSTFVLCVASGAHAYELNQTIRCIGLGCTDVRFVRPVFVGDTIWAESETVDRCDAGHEGAVIEFECRVYNQRDELVIKFRSQWSMSTPALPLQ